MPIASRAGGAALAVAAFSALGCGGRAISHRVGAAGNDGAAGRDAVVEASQDAPMLSQDANDGGSADTIDAPAPDAGASCRLGAFPAQPCRDPTCGHACGEMCVDLAIDVGNCGACGIACASEAPCVNGVCQPAPSVLVPAAPGCIELDLVLEQGQLTVVDFGHGTIKRVSTGGGDAKILASNLAFASIDAFAEMRFKGGIPYPSPTPALVRDGTVYFIAADAAPHDVTVRNEICYEDGGCVPDGPPVELTLGGGGTSIQAVTPGAPPVTLLPAELAPATWTTTLDSAAGAKAKPSINAIALSPDGKVLYFGAGGSFFAIPSTGAKSSADVKPLGPTQGQLTIATALVTDGRRLLYPSPYADEWLYFYDVAASCVPIQGMGYTYGCPPRVGASHVDLLMDRLLIREGWVYWVNGMTLRRADLSQLSATVISPTVATSPFYEGLSGFDVTSQYAYLADGVGGHIVRVPLALRGEPALGSPQPLAHDQRWPTSVVFDGTRAFWTTKDCDVKVIADPEP